MEKISMEEAYTRLKLYLVNDHKVVLSTLWVFILMNMIYADILNTLKPAYLQELEYVGKNLSGETVLLFAFLMEIPIAMILLSKILNREANRIANFIAAPVSILWVIIPSIVMSDGNTPLSYIFFATIEIITMAYILWYAWKWKTD
jgi:hypothetical protein